MKEIAYRYCNLPIPGGGYATGFVFHPKKKDVLYLRTDIGGSYKYDYEKACWYSLSESVNMFDLSETYPIAIALDEQDENMLYIASGIHASGHGKLSISSDAGATFIHREIPCYVHGNMNGRGTGYRLVRDNSRKDTLYFASQMDGLLKTTDGGQTWECLQTGQEKHMTLVWCAPDGQTVIAGTAGVDTGTKQMRGHSLYVSYDAGKSFAPMIMPESPFLADSKWSGYVAQRYAYDGTYFYCTLSHTGKYSYVTEMGYSCDSGDVLGGRILRYSFDQNGQIDTYTDITPACMANADGITSLDQNTVLDFGFSGISTCQTMPGLLAASTICRDAGDMIYISYDYGNSWQVALYDLSIGNLHFESPYMKPEYNGGHSLIHWLSDVKINPFCPDELWFNSGTGVFVSRNFTSENRSFCDCCQGIEETVHLNVYSPAKGPVQALDIVGDLGGFAFTDIHKPCENSFADAEGNRYITCINADFSDLHPETVAVTPRGNWKGKTKGGLILSKDYGLHFQRLNLPFGISDYLDGQFTQIETPNVNSGWIALSSDTQTLVYCVAEGIDLFMKGIIYSNNQGKTFQKTRIFNKDKVELSDSEQHMKVYSDRMHPDVFYGFGDGMDVYVSTDRGESFYEIEVPVDVKQNFKDVILGLIDCANKTEIRGDAGKEGVFYGAFGTAGLWKLMLYPFEHRMECQRLTDEQECVYRVGLGLLHPGSNYETDDKALYICGTIQNRYGFYRSFDEGKTWEKINNESQQFGDINSMDGDSRTFGRYYIATGSFGLKCGEQI